MAAGGVFAMLSHGSRSVPLVIVALLFIGLAYGCLASLSPVTLRFFGPGNYQDIVGVSLCQMIVASIIGPILSSRLLESSGNYFSSFIVITVVALLGVAVNKLIHISAHREGIGGE